MLKKSFESVRDLEVSGETSISELIKQFQKSGGFVCYYVSKAVDILRKMVSRDDCVRWISFPAAPIATGTRGVIVKSLRERYFHKVVTTCGMLDHDIARSISGYYSGEFESDDVELSRSRIHRLGSIYIPSKSYGETLEKFMDKFLEYVYDQGIREIGSFELCRLLGEYIEDEDTILRTAYKREIEIFVPGIVDGAIGTCIWLFHQKHRDFKLNLFRDLDKLAEITFKSKCSGALIIGGGISKHFLLWWNQFSGGLDYAVQITTAVEYDGSLSGARLSEAITWGKLKENAEYVTVYGDATLILPILIAGIESR
ncbi:MAG: deoxyhypusine synthase [Nitrososphaerota archaeon]